MTRIYYKYPRTMTQVDVSTTVGMSAIMDEISATVGEMSATMGEMSATVSAN